MDIPCFVVSLARAHERRSHITQELVAAGLSFEFVDALDAQQMTADQLRNLRRSKYASAFGLPMAAGDIACTFSHGLALQRVIDRNLPHAIIFEDDAKLEPGFAQALRRLMSESFSYDVLKLSGHPTNGFRTVCDLGDCKVIEPRIASFLSQGYIVTATGAKKLRPFTAPAADLMDHVLQQAWATKIVLYEVEPKLVGSVGTPSLIPNRHSYEVRPPFVGRWQRRVWKWRRSLWIRRQL
jgi:glycosyl transferase family 25